MHLVSIINILTTLICFSFDIRTCEEDEGAGLHPQEIINNYLLSQRTGKRNDDVFLKS